MCQIGDGYRPIVSERGARVTVKRIGLDLAKNVCELYGVDEHEQRVLSSSVRRGKLLETFARLPPCVVGMEDCGGALTHSHFPVPHDCRPGWAITRGHPASPSAPPSPPMRAPFVTRRHGLFT